MTNTLTIPSRFRGPSSSGNGGYVCGRVAAYVSGLATVTLRQPPPLDTPMVVEDDHGSVRVHHEGTLVSAAVPAPNGPPLEIGVRVSSSAAGQARYFSDPLFPDCFVCGVNREPGDGLRIFPGRVAGQEVWAASWTPDPSVADSDGRVLPEVVWAALDCPSGIAAIEATEGLSHGTAIVLGQMTANLMALPMAGDRCRVIAWPLRWEGRKVTAGSMLVGPDDVVLATAEALWLTVPHPGKAS